MQVASLKNDYHQNMNLAIFLNEFENLHCMKNIIFVKTLNVNITFSLFPATDGNTFYVKQKLTVH